MTKKTTAKQSSKALALELAKHRVPEKDAKQLVAQVGKLGTVPARLDICAVGFCGSYLLPPASLLRVLKAVKDMPINKFEVFPYGITAPELFHVRVEHVVKRG